MDSSTHACEQPEQYDCANSLITLVQSIGFPVEGGIECTTALKQLLAMIRSDDPTTRQVHVYLGNWNVMEKYLLPVLDCHSSDPKVALAVVRLIVCLTLPVPPGVKHEQTQSKHLQSYKALFVNSVFAIPKLMLTLAPALQSCSLRVDQKGVDWIELVITLFNNILEIPCPHGQKRLQDQAIIRFRDELVFDLIVVLCEAMHSETSGTLGLLLSQIIFNTLRGEQVPTLFKQAKSSSRLSDILRKQREKRHLLTQQMSARHSKFGGVVQHRTANNRMTVASIDDSDTVLHQTSQLHVKQRIYSSKKVPEALVYFLDTFLSNSCPLLIETIHSTLVKGHVMHVPSDYQNFFYITAFTLQYHRVKTEQSQTEYSYFPVRACIDKDIIRFAVSKIIEFDADKQWVNLDAVVFYLKELCHCAILVEPSNIHKIIKTVLFEHREVHKLLPNLLTHFNDKTCSFTYLINIFHLIHLSTLLLDPRSKEARDANAPLSYDFTRFLQRFTNNWVIRHGCSILEHFSDLPEAASAVASIFTAIAFDMEMSPMFFQLRVLVILRRILADTSLVSNCIVANVHNFALRTTKLFFEYSKTDKSILMEVVFWSQKSSVVELVSTFEGKEGPRVAKNFNKKRASKKSNSVSSGSEDCYHRSLSESDHDLGSFSSDEGNDIGIPKVMFVAKGWSEEDLTLLAEKHEEHKMDPNFLDLIGCYFKCRSPGEILAQLKKLGVIKNQGTRLLKKSRVIKRTAVLESSSDDDEGFIENDLIESIGGD